MSDVFRLTVLKKIQNWYPAVVPPPERDDAMIFGEVDETLAARPSMDAPPEARFVFGDWKIGAIVFLASAVITDLFGRGVGCSSVFFFVSVLLFFEKISEHYTLMNTLSNKCE